MKFTRTLELSKKAALTCCSSKPDIGFVSNPKHPRGDDEISSLKRSVTKGRFGNQALIISVPPTGIRMGKQPWKVADKIQLHTQDRGHWSGTHFLRVAGMAEFGKLLLGLVAATPDNPQWLLVGGGRAPFIVTNGPIRFGELQRAAKPITQKELTKQLRLLEAPGLVSRTVFPEVPPRVEYEVTPVARELIGALEALEQWMQNHGQKLVVPPKS